MVTDVLMYFLIGEFFVLCHCYHGYWCFVFFTRKPVTCILSVLCKFEVFSTKRIVLCPVLVGLCADVTIAMVTDVLLFSPPGELFSVLLSLQVLVSQSGCRRVAVLPDTELQTRLSAAAVIVSFPTWSGLHLMAPHPTPTHPTPPITSQYPSGQSGQELQTRLSAAAVIVSFPTWSGLHLMAPHPTPTHPTPTHPTPHNPLHHSTLLVNLDKNLYDCSALIFFMNHPPTLFILG